MAKDNNLQDFLTDIADAIREKKGTTEKINPQDFATEIANLSGGEETSNIEYLDISGLDEQIKYGLAACSFLVKTPEIKAIFPVGAVILESPSQLQKVTEIAILLQEKLVRMQHDVPILTIEQFLIEQGLDPNTIPRITKEEFYNLEQQPSELDA